MPAVGSPRKQRIGHSLRPSEQHPTEQASLTYLPPDLLPELAERAGVPQDALSTLTVGQPTDLYAAITEYVALSTPRAPLYSGGAETSSSSSDEESRPAVSRYRNRRRNKSTGLNRKPPLPNFRLALGIGSLTWPPPKHLTSDALAKTKGKVICNWPGAKPRDEVVPEEEANIISLHVANYTVGEPQSFAPAFRELLVVTKEDSATLRRFAKEICEWQYERYGNKRTRDGRFMLFRFRAHSGEWRSEGWKRNRSPDSVVLAGGMMQDILDDVGHFLKPETKTWYIEHCLPRRRSYLFYGPPGTGKTSTIRVIASKFQLTCCYLSMALTSLDNEGLTDALASLPERPLVVLEDVDALFNLDRENATSGGVTFSGLLNALDGLVSTDGVITILTTNNVNQLNKAVVRGGRVDRRFLFDRPSESQIKDLFLAFYPDAEEATINKFVRNVSNRREEEARMIATLQQLFIKMMGKTADECAAGVADFFQKCLPTVDNQESIYT